MHTSELRLKSFPSYNFLCSIAHLRSVNVFTKQQALHRSWGNSASGDGRSTLGHKGSRKRESLELKAHPSIQETGGRGFRNASHARSQVLVSLRRSTQRMKVSDIPITNPVQAGSWGADPLRVDQFVQERRTRTLIEVHRGDRISEVKVLVSLFRGRHRERARQTHEENADSLRASQSSQRLGGAETLGKFDHVTAKNIFCRKIPSVVCSSVKGH